MQWIVLVALLTQDVPEVMSSKVKKPNALELQVKALQSELQSANDSISQLKSALYSMTRERDNALSETDRMSAMSFADINVAGIAKSRPIKRVQWIITTSPSCGPCHNFVNAVTAAFGKRYKVGNDDECDFKIVSITQDEWAKAGYRLPRMDLMIDGVSVQNESGGTITIEQLEQTLLAKRKEFRENSRAETFGVRAGTLPVKPQIRNLLTALQPFLDGGTLTIEYKPKAGIVKEYLTIQQDQVTLRIPAKTSFSLGLNEKEAFVKFNQPTVQVRLPIRGNTDIKSMTLSPDKFAIQLSWMLDPEWTITEPPVRIQKEPIAEPNAMLFEEELNPFKRYSDNKQVIFAKWK